jgi:hypothetical protein
VVGQIIQCRVGGREGLNVKALKQRARQKRPLAANAQKSGRRSHLRSAQ